VEPARGIEPPTFGSIEGRFSVSGLTFIVS
jgi:hypothetical protein